jgi:hypothetical protein
MPRLVPVFLIGPRDLLLDCGGITMVFPAFRRGAMTRSEVLAQKSVRAALPWTMRGSKEDLHPCLKNHSRGPIARSLRAAS